MNWLESIIYGLISGITDFLPVSSQAHQHILLQLFGESNRDFVRDLFVHIAILISVYTGCRGSIEQIRRDRSLHQRRKHSRNGASNLLEMRLFKNAGIPMVFGMLVLSYITKNQLSAIWIALLLVLNGVILFIPNRMMQGNKDEHAMSGLDSLLLGISGALSALPGISRTGAMVSAGSALGASRQKATHWALIISIPAVVTLTCLDLIYIIAGTSPFPFWINLGGYILSGISAYLGGYIGISLVKLLAQRTGFSGFSFYSWGAALFTFILYLTVV